MTTIADLIVKTAKRLSASSDSPRLDAEVLLAWTLGLTRTSLQAHAQSSVDHRVETFFDQVVRLRQRGVPVAYITGRQPFMDFEVAVTPHTLIPRPFTETLVAAVLEHLRNDRHVVADIGTGSGVIALAIARHAPFARVIGTDISVPALQVAAANARRLDLLRQIDWRAGSLLTPLRHEDEVDTIIANLPYLPADDLREPSLRHEPTIALAGGPDGLWFITALVEQLPTQPILKTLVIELLPAQVDHVSHHLRLKGLAVEPISDGQAIRGVMARRS